MPRPELRELFVNTPKRLEVGFYTSSIDKFLQARLVLQEYGLQLRHFVSSQEPYHEDYDLGQQQLLARAIDEIKHRLGVNSVFFVEDTSLRVDVLSSADRDVPGLEVKEWFSQTSFVQLDSELRKRGNNRSAKVCSDIALHVPGLTRSVFIHGETTGHVAETPPDFKRSDQYPWLTPYSFNGWFIPAGTKKRLGEMSFEESLDYDFRVRSLANLVERLEEYAAALNLGVRSYSVKRPRMQSAGFSLFKDNVSLYLVVGKLCAGKTTMGQYASLHHPNRFQHIEASSMVRMLAEEACISAPTPFYRAKELLNMKGPSIVARSIVGMYGDRLRDGAVITGFRTIEEVQYIRTEFPSCKVVFIAASERTRFQRHLSRGRLESVVTLHDFREHDKQQMNFGLLQIAHELADLKIENEETLKEYHAQIEALLKGEYTGVPGVSDVKQSGKTLRETRLFRCLRALDELSAPVSCPEIASLTDRQDPIDNAEFVERISPRHVNWVLKDYPELARRVDAKGDRVRYQILQAGRAYLDAIKSMKE